MASKSKDEGTLVRSIFGFAWKMLTLRPSGVSPGKTGQYLKNKNIHNTDTVHKY